MPKVDTYIHRALPNIQGSTTSLLLVTCVSLALRTLLPHCARVRVRLRAREVVLVDEVVDGLGCDVAEEGENARERRRRARVRCRRAQSKTHRQVTFFETCKQHQVPNVSSFLLISVVVNSSSAASRRYAWYKPPNLELFPLNAHKSLYPVTIFFETISSARGGCMTTRR